MLVTGDNMRSELIKNSSNGVFDYGLLMSVLSHYKAPHRKITLLLKSKQIIRIKKGLYLLGNEYRQEPVNRELLANLIFGPSYVSQEYALQYYGLIPERVETVTSMTTKRKKSFSTPVGRFVYSYINAERFTTGIDWIELSPDTHVLMASPEKAIADTVAFQRSIKTIKHMKEHLIENLRMEEEALRSLDMKRAEKISLAYRHPTIALLYKTLRAL